MKLRNKKTGEICELGHIRQAWREEKDGGMGYMFLKADDNNGIIYDSLAEMMDEWEDYKPAEPLIKDEKIRKAVRVWLESWENTNDNWQYWEQDYEEFHIARGDIEIIFPVSNGAKAGWYTIAELCGEEEE